MSGRKGRPSFLRPLTQIAPQTNDSTHNAVAHLGTTSKGSISSASAGSRPRSNSSGGKTADPVPNHFGAANPIATASAASSRASSRRSSFAPNVAGHRKSSTVVREPTSSRRGSIWSSLGEDADTNLTEEDKAEAARKAFSSSFKTIWESGIDKITRDWWSSLITGWKSGEVIGLFSIDDLGLSRMEHARAIVLVDELHARLHALAVTTLAFPGAIQSVRALDRHHIDSTLDQLLESPMHLSLLLRVLETFSNLFLQVFPAFLAHLEYPESLNPAFFSLINLVTFLSGSSTDLRRAIVAFINVTSELSTMIDSFTRAVVDITSRLPPNGAIPHPHGDFLYSPAHTLKQFAELRNHAKSLFAQPSFVNATEIFAADIRATWNGLVGNARVARAARNVERIWNNSWSGYKYKFASLVDALDAIQWEIAPISSETEEFSYAFTALKPHFPSLIPDDVSVTYASAGVGGGAPSSILLRKVRIEIKSALYEITKRGLLPFTDSGSAAIIVPLDVEIDFTSENPTVVPQVTGKVEVILHTGHKSSSTTALKKVWNSWLSAVVSAKFTECVESRINQAVDTWLEPLFGYPPPVPKPQSSVAASSPVDAFAEQPGAATPSSVTVSQQAALSRQWAMSPSAPLTPGVKSPASAGPGGARAAFIASFRRSSGVDIRPLATGRDVLESLANPFSGPNSVGGDDDDEVSIAGSSKSRRMSMAMSLTDVARTDSTAMANIENPPRSRSLSQVVLDDGPQAFMSSGPASRRLSLVYTPTGEPSLDAYDHDVGTSVSQSQAGVPRGRTLSMGEHLDEQSQQDTTTPEGISAHAKAKKSSLGFPAESLESSRVNVSMTRVTMELQGHNTPLQQQFEASAPRTGTPATREGKPRRKESYGGMDITPAARRKSMSEYLTEAAMTDATDPTINPVSRRISARDENVLPAYHRPSMSAALDPISSVDTTLPENIASPPRSRHGSSAHHPRANSFTALEDVPTMAEIGIDHNISKDTTEASGNSNSEQPKVARRKAEEYAGINPAELKNRRMSSFATDATNIDTTLLQNIHSPPSVDQKNYDDDDVSSKPHSLASRRLSAAAAAVAGNAH